MFRKESTALPESPVPAAFPLHAHSGAEDIPCMSITVSLIDENQPFQNSCVETFLFVLSWIEAGGALCAGDAWQTNHDEVPQVTDVCRFWTGQYKSVVLQ